ncbi:helix-turn-helix transcriptional regulator [Spirillospora sp. NPDC047279]|uniref:helix-turn-helix transcriptional regulator n=1 Tax=Spirillospora sp. NPDC047279 TaxID=3155478 RepID=UPI0033DF3251
MRAEGGATRSVLSTTDPGEATAFLMEAYAGRELRISGDGGGFRFTAVDVAFAGIHVNWLRHSMAAYGTTEPAEHLVIAQSFGTGFWLGTGREQVRLGRAEIAAKPPHLPAEGGWDRLRAHSVQLPMELIARVAAENTGIRPAELAFTLARPANDAVRRHWTLALRHVVQGVLSVPEVAANPLVLGQAARTLAVAALATFTNTAMTLDPTIDPLVEPGTGRDSATPAVVRRAVAFVQENAHRDITLTDIAAAARIGPRGLAYAFRRHLDTTPMSHLRRVRLEGAHVDLCEADPASGVTVESIARAWAFTHLGRFAELYRHAYGRPPSHDLRT